MHYIYINPNRLDLDKYSYQNIRIFEYFASTNIFVFVFGSNLIFQIYSYSYSFKMDISNIFDIRIRGKKGYSSRTDLKFIEPVIAELRPSPK